MKVLQVLSGTAWGGASVVVLAITRTLIARGDRVWVVSLDDETDRQFRDAGAEIVRPPLWFQPISPFDLYVLWYLWRLCRKEKFDLVATHTSKGGFLGRLAARLAGIRCIVHHAHGFSFNRAVGPLTRRFYILLERLAANAGDLIISVNELQRRMAVQLGVDTPERICTVHNGIDLLEYSNHDGHAARRALGLDKSALLIGSIGRLAPQKGLVYLIRAMPQVLEAVPAARLVVVGEGPLRGSLESEAERCGIKSRVHFLGFRREIPQLLAALDVFAQPSLWEGLSISLIEALAAGKPIVATDIVGNREVVDNQETALIVPTADPAALAEGLCALLLDPVLAAKLAANARRAALERFSEERMVRENLAAYDRVRASRAPADARRWSAASAAGTGALDSTDEARERGY